MRKGISLHVGLDAVDPDAYEGWDGQLISCERDARDMRVLARARGFSSSRLLLGPRATAAAVRRAILAAAEGLADGGLFFLSYSGHGGQVRDTNGDERASDRRDETWVLFDRMLVDDELFALWGAFRPGARVIVLSDSCHSGTVSRATAFEPSLERVRSMPWRVGDEVERAHGALYRGIQESCPAAERARPGATVLLIAGCQDNQLSLDGDRNGLFTGTLRKVWRGGRFEGSYRDLRDAISARMPRSQTPNYLRVGPPHPTFETEQAFSI